MRIALSVFESLQFSKYLLHDPRLIDILREVSQIYTYKQENPIKERSREISFLRLITVGVKLTDDN